jgi:hypothetical protein
MHKYLIDLAILRSATIQSAGQRNGAQGVYHFAQTFKSSLYFELEVSSISSRFLQSFPRIQYCNNNTNSLRERDG